MYFKSVQFNVVYGVRGDIGILQDSDSVMLRYKGQRYYRMAPNWTISRRRYQPFNITNNRYQESVTVGGIVIVIVIFGINLII